MFYYEATLSRGQRSSTWNCGQTVERTFEIRSYNSAILEL